MVSKKIITVLASTLILICTTIKNPENYISQAGLTETGRSHFVPPKFSPQNEPSFPATIFLSSSFYLIMVTKNRDPRTAYQKWQQGIAEARQRGYWALHKYPLPPGLLVGWDHTKQNNTSRLNDAQNTFPTRGTVPPNIQDDTEDGLTIVVSRLPAIDQDGLVDQTQARVRRVYVQGIPASNRGQTGRTTKDLAELHKDMKSGVLEGFHEIAGPRWKEWCAWDEEYVWERFLNGGFVYCGYHQLWNSSLTDWMYRRVRADMQNLAEEQGMKSWTELMRDGYEVEEEALFQRFRNYLSMHGENCPSPSPPMDLPRSWAMVQHDTYYPATGSSYFDAWNHRQYRRLPLDLALRDSEFEVELKRWTKNFYLREQQSPVQVAKPEIQTYSTDDTGNTSRTTLSPDAKSFTPTQFNGQHKAAAAVGNKPRVFPNADITSSCQYSAPEVKNLQAHCEYSSTPPALTGNETIRSKFSSSRSLEGTWSPNPSVTRLAPIGSFW